MKVYAVLVDTDKKVVGLNIKDSTLPDKVKQYEGKIGFFGGKVESGESHLEAVNRELEEEIPGFVNGEPEVVYEAVNAVFYKVECDLSGHRHTRDTDRIGQLAKVCREGDGVVRSFNYILRSSEDDYVHSSFKDVLVKVIGS